jgi:hypothetical protein
LDNLLFSSLLISALSSPSATLKAQCFVRWTEMTREMRIARKFVLRLYGSVRGVELRAAFDRWLAIGRQLTDRLTAALVGVVRFRLSHIVRNWREITRLRCWEDPLHEARQRRLHRAFSEMRTLPRELAVRRLGAKWNLWRAARMFFEWRRVQVVRARVDVIGTQVEHVLHRILLQHALRVWPGYYELKKARTHWERYIHHISSCIMIYHQISSISSLVLILCAHVSTLPTTNNNNNNNSNDEFKPRPPHSIPFH